MCLSITPEGVRSLHVMCVELPGHQHAVPTHWNSLYMVVLTSKRLLAGWWTSLRTRPRTSSTSDAPTVVRLRALAEAWPLVCCTNSAVARAGGDARRRQPLHLPVHHCSRLQAAEWVAGHVLQLPTQEWRFGTL